MELNQVASGIRFVGSTILKFNIENEEHSIIALQGNERIGISLDIDVVDIEHTDNGLLGILILSIKTHVHQSTSEEDHDSEFELILQGAFHTKTLPENEFIQHLYINGGTTLYSLARTLMMQFSASTYQSGKILLPMINMIEFLNEKKKKEEEKAE